MKKYNIKLNGKVYEVEMEEVTGQASAAISASQAAAPAVKEVAPTTVEKEIPVQPAAPSAPVAGAETIAAPMPGSIVEVAVKVGDQVKKGQLLAVLEAMKMENEIVSPVDGKIVSVAVAKGDTVNAGDTLLQIA